ncbi:IS1182 family transposase [Aerococcus tenax]
MNQTTLPLELSACIDPDHIVFSIYNFIESLDEKHFESFSTQDGRPAYHPKPLIMALLYAYSKGVFSGRKIEELMVENIPMQWLVAQQVISYRTINRFRSSENCRCLLENLFVEFTTQLKLEKLIHLENCFIDGTKIEANANKYSFVWKKATEKYAEQLKVTSREYYFNEIQPMVDAGIQYDENLDLEENMLQEISKVLKDEIDKLTEDIEETPVKGPDQRKQERRRLKKHYRKVSKDFLPRKQKYAKQFETFNGRNSYSKTDPDATFMRMKDDHMMNGQLKAGYNIQVATENQFVLHYDIFHNPTDTRTLQPFVESFPNFPKCIIADAGYGSEENLTYLDNHKINHLIKYNRFDKEQKKKHKKSAKNMDNWSYDKQSNTFTHPDGTVYFFSHLQKRKNKMSGYISEIQVYKPLDPKNAPQKALYYNKNYQELKNIETQKLLSEEGSKLFSKRKIDVEPVFGQIKAILGFTRFNLRGKTRVKTDVGLAFMANNLKKYSKIKAIK